MTKIARIASIAGIMVMLLLLLVTRQVNQLTFIHIQNISKEQRTAQQSVNQLMIDYLREKNRVPIWAKQQGYKVWREENVK